MNRLTIEEIDAYLKYIGDDHVEQDGIKDFLPVRIAKQLADTMRENERLKTLLRNCYDWCNRDKTFAIMYSALKAEFDPELPNKESDNG